MSEFEIMDPHDLAIEQAVIASALIDGGKEMPVCISNGVTEDVFYSPAHKVIWNRLEQVYHEKSTVDLLLLMEAMTVTRELEQAGGYKYINQVASSIETTVRLQHWIPVLLEKWRLRKLKRLCENLIAAVGDTPRDVDLVLTRGVRELTELTVQNRALTQVQLVDQAMELFRQELDQNEEEDGLRLGLIDFDHKMGRLRVKKEHFLAIPMAPPSQGKSALARQMMRVNCMDGKRCVAFLRETTAPVAYQQMAANWAEFNLHFAKHPPMEPMREQFASMAEYDHERANWLDDLESWESKRDQTWKHFNHIRDNWAGKNLWIYDVDTTIGQIEARCRYLASQANGLDMVVVDYLQIVRSDKEAWSRENEIANIAERLHDLGKELRCTVVAPVQMNREGRRGIQKKYYHKNKDGSKDMSKPPEDYIEYPMPQLSDARESGAIEQAADWLMGIYTPAIDYNGSLQRASWNKLLVEFHLLKNRNGRTGKCRFFFRKDITTFQDIGNVTPQGVYLKKGQYPG